MNNGSSNVTTTTKYVGVQFQGKSGTLIINEEKVIFRPKLTAVEKQKAIKPVARSWRWAAIDRVEVLDPPRNSPKERSIKLKSKVAQQKAVTLILPTDFLDDIVQDMNQRLSSTALGVEGSLSPSVQKKMAPATARRKSTGITAARVFPSTIAEENDNEDTNSSKQPPKNNRPTSTANLKPSSRRASMPETTKTVRNTWNKKVAAAKETDKEDPKKSDTKGAAPAKKPAAEIPFRNKIKEEDKINTTTNNNKPKRSVRSSVTAATQKLAQPIQKLKASAKEQVKTHAKFPLLKPPEAHRSKEEPKEDDEPEFSTEDEIPLLSAQASSDDAEEPANDTPDEIILDDSNHNNSTNGDKEKDKSSKRPFLHFLKPPPPRRNITNEFENIQESLQLMAKPTAAANTGTAAAPKAAASNGATNNTSGDNKPKPRPTMTGKRQQSANSGFAANSSSNHTKKKETTTTAPPPLQNKPKPSQQQSPTPRRHTFLTPQPQPKPKVVPPAPLTSTSEHKKKTRSSWTPSAGMVYTPPPAAPAANTAVDKVPRDIMVAPFLDDDDDDDGHDEEETKQEIEIDNGGVPEDIVFTPSQTEIIEKEDPMQKMLHDYQHDKENNKQEKDKDESASDDDSDNVEEYDDEASASTGSQPVSSIDDELEEPKHQCRKVDDGPSSSQKQLWNPQSPENMFRMMILQHAANCAAAKGSCQYDPICSDYKRVLAHIVTCNAGDECDVDKCRATKQFLLTMQFMKEISADNANVAKIQQHKDFLVGVGAVAPVPVIQFSDSEHHRDSDAFSVVSNSTWWSADWGEVEQDQDEDDS